MKKPMKKSAKKTQAPRLSRPAKNKARRGAVTRKTRETAISVKLDLDGRGRSAITTGIGFFDHMLEQIARHGLMDIALTAKGDLHVDQHHTVEDCGIALGEAFARALGAGGGIRRFACAYLPMDETLTRVAVDISGRAYLVWRVELPDLRLGEIEAETIPEFFRGFSQAAGITLHVENLYGGNTHHIIESCFKGLARALRDAVAIDPREAGRVPSTKGMLDIAKGTKGGGVGA